MRQQSFGLSMDFEVQITDEAFADLDVIAGFIKREAGFGAKCFMFATGRESP